MYLENNQNASSRLYAQQRRDLERDYKRRTIPTARWDTAATGVCSNTKQHLGASMSEGFYRADWGKGTQTASLAPAEAAPSIWLL
jgi:hypothetical protein